MTVDPKSYELAAHFLRGDGYAEHFLQGDGYTAEETMKLAVAIQQAVEDWLESKEGK